MAADRTVTVRLQAVVDGWKRSMSDAGKSVDGLGEKTKKNTKDADKSLKDMGKSAAISGRALAVGLAAGAYAAYKLAGAAGDLMETQSKVNEIFGKSADSLDGWSDSAATALGQSKQQALDAASTFGIFGKSAGLAGQDLVAFSKQTTALATDLASFNNTSPEDAITALGAALRGESEPIRRYGVLLDDATLRARAMKMGLIETTKEALTPQQRVLAAYNEILAQTTTQQGDFARTSDGLANSQRIAAAEFANTKAELGEGLVPVMTSVMKVSASVLGTFNDLPGPVRTTTIAVAALGAAAFLLVPKVLAARTALLEYNAAQLASGKSAASARGAMRGAAGVLAGPWGLAIGAGITALGIFSAKHAEGKKRVEDMTEAIKADSGALGENARAQAVSVLTANGAIAAAERLGISLETVTDAALGSPAAQDALSASLDQYAVSATQAMNAGRGGATALTLQQQAAIMLTNATDSQANATVLATEGARRQAEAMGGATYAAYQLGSAQSDTAADTKALNDEIAKQIGLLEDQATAALDVADAEQRYRDDMRDAKEKLDALNDAVRKHGESSKAAKLAQEAYDQSIRDATRSAIDAARKTRDKAVADAEAAGSADSAATANAAYRTELDKLRDKAKKGSALRKNLNGLIADLDALGKDRTANVVINIAQRASTINKANRIDAATAKGKAGGGLVVGYGSGTSDSVPINASNGEFVMKASAVKRIGVGTLSAMNSGQSGGSITSLAPVFHIDARGSTMTAQEFRAIAKTAVDDGYRELLTQSRAR